MYYIDFVRKLRKRKFFYQENMPFIKYIISIVVLILSTSYVGTVNGAKILAVFPSVWKSHYLFGQAILSNLAERGHHITVISPFLDVPKDNFTNIQIHGIEDNWLEMGLSFNCNEIRQDSIIERFTKLIYATTSGVDILLKNKDVQNLLKSDNKFDLLILDLFLSDALLGLAHYYKVPAIVIGSKGPSKWSNEMTGNPHNSALDPNSFLPLMENMDIWERTVNTLMSIFEELTYKILHMPYQEAVYQRHFSRLIGNKEELPPLIDLVHNVSLALINSHPIVQYPRAFVPNVIEVGGAHIKRNMTILSKVFNKFIEEAPDGAIYINFGINMNISDLPKDKLDALLGAINTVRDRMQVILKWEQLVMENQPPNTVIGEWLPQSEILGHPKVKIFITTGGLMSAMEALDTGTPILGIPIFPEQNLNIMRLERLGCAIRIDYDNLTTENLMWGINEIMKNPKYEENAKRVSKLFNDNLNTPIEKSIFYIEYVLRTNGAIHLRSVATQLGFFRTKLLDVSLIILIGILVILAVPSIIICIILRKNNSNRPEPKAKSTNNIKQKKKKQ